MKRLITAIIFLPGFVYVLAQTKTKVAKMPQAAPKEIAASITRGTAVYRQECLSCHQADGSGVPHLNPPLTQSTTVLKDSKKSIAIILKGMSDRTPIDDEYYSNNMAPHNNLTDQQIADVLTYIRNNFGNKANAVTPAEVKAVRGAAVKKIK
jgi:mono/diheme cytochrome c family protein